MELSRIICDYLRTHHLSLIDWPKKQIFFPWDPHCFQWGQSLCLSPSSDWPNISCSLKVLGLIKCEWILYIPGRSLVLTSGTWHVLIQSENIYTIMVQIFLNTFLYKNKNKNNYLITNKGNLTCSRWFLHG